MSFLSWHDFLVPPSISVVYMCLFRWKPWNDNLLKHRVTTRLSFTKRKRRNIMGWMGKLSEPVKVSKYHTSETNEAAASFV